MAKIEIGREHAAVVLEVLEARLEVIHQLESRDGYLVSGEVARQKEAILPVMMALEALLKTLPHQ